MMRQHMRDGIDDWMIFEGILDRARTVMHLPYVILWSVDLDAGFAHPVCLTGVQSKTFMRAMRIIRKVFPSFDVAGLRFRTDGNPLTRRIHYEAQVAETTAAELVEGEMNPFLVELVARVAGHRFVLMHPIVVDSRVAGTVVFSSRQPYSASQRRFAIDCSRQVRLMWENVVLARRLADRTPDAGQGQTGSTRSAAASSPGESTAGGRLSSGGITLDVGARTAYQGGQWLALTSLELTLLAFFLSQPERSIDRDELARKVWGYPEATSNFVDKAVMRLRRKLEANHNPRLIHAVRGRGYILRLGE